MGVKVVLVQETFIIPWLLWSAQYKIPYTVSSYESPSPSNLVVPGRMSLVRKEEKSAKCTVHAKAGLMNFIKII